MDFNHFLSAYYPDKAYGGDRLYADMIAQAKLAERLGFKGVTIPEHHLINILLVPDPLQMAVKVASVTERVEIITSVCVLPIHDMRTFAGAAVQSDILCDGRLILGVGRGAFGYETARMGVPLEQTREKFDESLDLLMALHDREEVGWAGKYYNFAPITVMPRPVVKGRPAIMMAALVPDAIYHSAKRGFHIQTNAAQRHARNHEGQVDAFNRGKAELGDAGRHLRLALSRVTMCARDQAQADRLLEHAAAYYRRFDNVFTGPGIVDNGMIRDLRYPHAGTAARQPVICTASEMIDKLAVYAELGVDDVITSSNLGVPLEETVEAMERFATEVMPHFKTRPMVNRAAAG